MGRYVGGLVIGLDVGLVGLDFLDVGFVGFDVGLVGMGGVKIVVNEGNEENDVLFVF